MNLQKMEKNTKYYIKVIENENDREFARSYKYGAYQNVYDCMEDAEMMHKKGYLYIEVVDEHDNIYCEYEN